MHVRESHVKKSDIRASVSKNGAPENHPKVVVCVDAAEKSPISILPAKAIAKALGAELTFTHVVETQSAGQPSPFDPVEWDIRRREAEAHVSNLADLHRSGGASILTRVLEGRCAEQICNALGGRTQDIVVLLRKDSAAGPRVGETARYILESGNSSLLLVPAGSASAAKDRFDRIIVTVDGSGQSESAIPLAMKIAESENAEIILVHASPEPVFTQVGPEEPNDKELLELVRQRNARVAKKYLDRLCSRIRANGVKARSVILSGGDVRRHLTRSVEEQSADLLILASHGHSGFADVPLGDTANFILSHASVPVLMVRRGVENLREHVYSGTLAKGIRRPGASAT
jgi:nucleotide-binding universal stress UspA family protein